MKDSFKETFAFFDQVYKIGLEIFKEREEFTLLKRQGEEEFRKFNMALLSIDKVSKRIEEILENTRDLITEFSSFLPYYTRFLEKEKKYLDEEIKRAEESAENLNKLLNEVQHITIIARNSDIRAFHLGEKGKGLAVVSQELGSLTNRIGTIAKKIGEYISVVKESFEKMEDEREAFSLVFERLTKMKESLGDIIEDLNVLVSTMKGIYENVNILIQEEKSIFENIHDFFVDIESLSFNFFTEAEKVLIFSEAVGANEEIIEGIKDILDALKDIKDVPKNFMIKKSEFYVNNQFDLINLLEEKLNLIEKLIEKWKGVYSKILFFVEKMNEQGRETENFVDKMREDIFSGLESCFTKIEEFVELLDFLSKEKFEVTEMDKEFVRKFIRLLKFLKEELKDGELLSLYSSVETARAGFTEDPLSKELRERVANSIMFTDIILKNMSKVRRVKIGSSFMIEGEKIKKLRDGLEKIENSLKTIWGGISRAEASVEWFKGWMDRVKGFVSKVHTDFEIIKEKIGSVRKELAEARTTLRKFLPVYEDIEKEEEIVLKIPLGSDPVTLNPYLSTDAVSNIVIDSIHRSLFMVSPKSSKVLPFIVYRFEISDDGKRYIFELRRNVKFHDGTVVTASDVKKSLLRTLKGNLKHYFNMIKGADDYIKGFETDVEGIKVINDFKLEIELEYPFSPFIKNLALNAASITREKNNILIGCGPFKLVKWKKGEYIELECFEDYIAGRACVDRIIFQIKLKNELEDFINRNFDLIEPSKTHIEILKEKAPEYIDRLQMVPQFSVQRFDFNVKKEPLTDIHIRKAIAHAVDVDRFVKEITGQAGIRAKGVLPPSSEFYDETLEPLEYNLEKAKEELKKSEFKPPYKLIVIVRPAEAYKRNARFVLECIKDLGFEFEFVERDWAGLLEDIKKGKAHCHFIGWLADTGDPDSIFYPVFYSSSIGKGGNEMHFSDPEIDALIEEARRKRLPEERKKIYNIIERKIIEKCPCIFLYHPYQMLILNKGVYGIWPHPLGHFRLELALKLSSKWIR